MIIVQELVKKVQEVSINALFVKDKDIIDASFLLGKTDLTVSEVIVFLILTDVLVRNLAIKIFVTFRLVIIIVSVAEDDSNRKLVRKELVCFNVITKRFRIKLNLLTFSVNATKKLELDNLEEKVGSCVNSFVARVSSRNFDFVVL